MSTVAYLVIGERHYRAVFLDAARAAEEAAKHHGIMDGLVRESILRELVQAAFEAGAKQVARKPVEG